LDLLNESNWNSEYSEKTCNSADRSKIKIFKETYLNLRKMFIY